MKIDMDGFWFQTLPRVMDLIQTQHRVISQNIANANTPGFARQKIDFQSELSRVLESAESNGDSGAQGFAVEEDRSAPVRQDQNNVSMEKEMVDLSESNQLYHALSRIAATKIKLAREVISGR